MPTPFAIVDAFVSESMAGNPAAVCLLDAPASDEWMHDVAAEFALPMTAFVGPADHDGARPLRWFTAAAEADLCGHATLAAAHVLGAEVVFTTRAGELRCRPADGAAIEMDFPAIAVEEAADPAALCRRVRAAPDVVARGFTGGHWIVLELHDEAAVRSFEPDLAALRAAGALVVFATPAANGEADSVCRMFNPGAGLDEDAVTGSAHCILAALLGRRTGRRDFVGVQVSSRGGRVGMSVRDGRVLLRGAARTFATGVLGSQPR